MVDPFLRAAQRHAAKLEAELKAIPAFRQWLVAKAVIDSYDKEASTPTTRAAAPPPVSQQPVKTSDALVEASTQYLRRTNRRATSTVLATALIAQGVHIPGKNQAATLAAHLSQSRDTIDNVKGEGYGLKEWSTKLPSGSSGRSNDEAPEGGNPSGASLNGHASHAH